jgi:hypothetical protein
MFLLGILINMAAVKRTRTFSVNKEILAEINRAEGDASESELTEKRAALEQEIASFFAAHDCRAERRAFQFSSLKSWTRERNTG